MIQFDALTEDDIHTLPGGLSADALVAGAILGIDVLGIVAGWEPEGEWSPRLDIDPHDDKVFESGCKRAVVYASPYYLPGEWAHDPKDTLTKYFMGVPDLYLEPLPPYSTSYDALDDGSPTCVVGRLFERGDLELSASRGVWVGEVWGRWGAEPYCCLGRVEAPTAALAVCRLALLLKKRGLS